jgi:uncharacterized protein (UPF0248 family)
VHGDRSIRALALPVTDLALWRARPRRRATNSDVRTANEQLTGGAAVIPIRSLLDRIRWDPEFGAGAITIGYYDRVARAIVTVPYANIHVEPGNHFSFSAIEADGSAHEVPFHRVREVRRNGRLIWQRKVEPEPH